MDLERVTWLIAGALGIEAPEVELGDHETRPSASLREYRIRLRDRAPGGEAELLHDIAHELTHLRRRDQRRELDLEGSSKQELALEVVELWIIEVAVEAEVQARLPGVDIDAAYRRPLKTRAPAGQARWALTPAVLSALGRPPAEAEGVPRWVVAFGEGIASCYGGGDHRAWCANLLQHHLSREELLELLTEPGMLPEAPPEDECSDSDKPGQDGGWDSPEQDARPIPLRIGHEARAEVPLQALGGFAASSFDRLEPGYAYRASPHGALRPSMLASSLASQTLFEVVPDDAITLLIDGGTEAALLAEAYVEAIGAFRARYRGGEVLVARCVAEAANHRAEIRDRIWRVESGVDLRRMLATGCDGGFPLATVLEGMLSGRLACPQRLIVLGWPWSVPDPFRQERWEVALDELERGGVEVYFAGSACFDGLLGDLVAAGEDEDEGFQRRALVQP